MSAKAARKTVTIVAIDGPAGSGKSTVARRVARRMRLPYLDTGAMYRALTVAALQKSVSLQDPKALGRLAKRVRIELECAPGRRDRVRLDGEDVTRMIRTPELTQQVHWVARAPEVRSEMVRLQRRAAAARGGVLEGRDIGTVVFPKAPFKFYLDADLRERTARRLKELKAKGVRVSFKKLYEDQKARDLTDTTRKVGPLKPAEDAIRIDTTELTITGVVGRILKLVSAKRAGRGKM
ncbi:MAG: (d)CMP kinase [Candidatus Omnitrophica bacterium]|nr:(d)CMP kinase [Candidatus Omnitrophota bacterium]